MKKYNSIQTAEPFQKGIGTASVPGSSAEHDIPGIIDTVKNDGDWFIGTDYYSAHNYSKMTYAESLL